MDEPAIAAAEAAIQAEVAADAAGEAAAAAAVAAAEPMPDPNVLINADVELARQQEETERAKIEARRDIKIAEINQEEPPWLSDIREFLIRLEGRMETMEGRLQPSIPAASTVIVNPEPEPEPISQSEEGGDRQEAEINPVVQPAKEAEKENNEPVPPAQRRRPRWI